MNLRKPRPEEPEINLIPLIDILFFLLLFFMLSSTFDHVAAVNIDLPTSSASQPLNSQQNNIDVLIDRDGNYSVNGRRLVNSQVSTLVAALKLAMGSQEHPPLTISADGRTPHQAVVTAMDAARQVGILHFSIATRETQEAGH